MSAVRLAAVTFLLLPGVGVTAEAEPQGVGPADKQAYGKRVADKFACFDGSKTIALSALNDDFCDCADGSDEPGTAACAGIDHGRAAEVFFYCENRGARPRYVYRSHVQDGVCDCCDGSDESQPSGIPTVAGRAESCPNFCDEESRPYREAQEAVLARWQMALDLQKNISETTEMNLPKLQEELDKLNMEMDGKRNAMRDAAVRLAQLEKQLNDDLYWGEYYELKRIEEEEGEEAVTKALRKSKHFGYESLGQGTTTTTQILDMPDDIREVFLGWKRTEDQVVLSRRRKEDLDVSLDEQLLKEHASLATLEGQCLSLDVEDETDSSVTITNEVCFFREAAMYIHHQTPPEDDQTAGAWAAMLCSPKKSQECAMARGSGPGSSNNSLISQCDHIQRVFNCAREANCCGGHKSVEELQKHIDGKLAEKCPNLRNPCAKKSLGRWKGWSFHGQKAPHAEFENGDNCKEDDGQKNAAVVKFVCGAKVRLKALAETSQCRFEASVIHPAACVSALAPKEPGPRLDKFMQNVAVKTELESEAKSKIEEWQTNQTYFESEITRLENLTIEKKDVYETTISDKEKKAKVSEYAKWMEKENLETSTTTTTMDPLADHGDEHDEIRRMVREYKIEKPRAEKDFWDSKWRSKGLEVILRDDLGGLRRAFADLESKCLEMKADGKGYQVCFYRQARRNETDEEGNFKENNLGRFVNWDFSGELPTAIFKRGDYCEGKQHETEVAFRCSAELTPLSVTTETGGCKTKMEASHPAGCDASSPPELPPIPSHPRKPKDEL